MNQPNETYVIQPPAPPKPTIRVVNGGANRGARENLRAFAEYNERTQGAKVVPIYSDPAPGRAVALREEAKRHGIEAEAVEGKVEDIVRAEDTENAAPLLLNLDRASGIASVLRSTVRTKRATLGYLLVRLPTDQLWGIRFALQAGDDRARTDAISFFEKLAEVSERNGSGAILGEGGKPSHRLAEPAIRAWFGEHTKANLAKVASNLEPVSNSFEVTPNGKDTLQMMIVAGGEWSDPLTLAQSIVENPSQPLRRGTRFVLAEVTPDGIRLHQVRRRTDDKVSVSGAEVVDRVSMEARARTDRAEEAAAIEAVADAGRRAVRQREAAEALARAALSTLSRRNPVQTTD